MSYFKRQYTRLQDYMLERKINQNPILRQPGDFQSSESIGILFDANDMATRKIVLEYAEGLKKHNKKVELLAFYKSKKQENNFPFKHFTQKQLNFLRQPDGAIVKDFMFEPFDILINLFLNGHPALEYISALSAAHLRVGPYTERTYCYDLMIDTANRGDLPGFIKQVEFLLNKVNKKSHEITSA